MNKKDYIYIVETIEAVPGKEEELKKELLKIVPLAQKEEGCVLYDLHQDRSNPRRFVVLMCWKTAEAYEGHGNAEYINKFVEKFDKVLYITAVEGIYRKLH
jgi:quinol monooxygenase YgiN